MAQRAHLGGGFDQVGDLDNQHSRAVCRHYAVVGVFDRPAVASFPTQPAQGFEIRLGIGLPDLERIRVERFGELSA